MFALPMAHILVVEDETSLRELLAEILALDGHTVSTAEDGRAALQQLRRTRPEVILLDLLLPDTDGWTFARQCQTDPVGRDIPILVVSVVNPQTVRRQLAGTSVRGVIEKPFNFEQLLALVDATIRP
jgi:CheY-like chemotaxis protein